MDSNVPLPEVESTPRKANQIMRQPDGKDGENEIFKTFNEWANIRDLPSGFDYQIAHGLTSQAISLPIFKDVLSEFFSDQKKTKDADKIFPRQSRINAIKENLSNDGDTPAPVNYNVGNAQWKFHNKNSFQYLPDRRLDLKIGSTPHLLQKGGVLYANMKQEDQDSVKSLYQKQPKHLRSFELAPVTAIEDSYMHFIKAHIYHKNPEEENPIWGHHGRDGTFDQLKMGISSSFAKLLVQKIINKCPGCKERVTISSEVGKEREKKTKAKRKAGEEAQQVVPTKKHRSEKYANLANTQIQNPGFAEMILPMDYHNLIQPDNAGTMYAGYNYPLQDQPIPWGTINPEYNLYVQNHPGLLGSMTGYQYQHQPNFSGPVYNGFDPSQNQPGPSGTINPGYNHSVQNQPGLFGTTTGNQYQHQLNFSGAMNAGFAYPVQNQPVIPGTMYTGPYPQANHETFVNDCTIDPDLTQSIAALDYELDTPEQRLFTFVGAFNRSSPDTNSTLPPTQYTQYTQYSGSNENPSVPPSDFATPEQSFEPSIAVPDSNSSTSDPAQNESPDQLLDFVGAYDDIGPNFDNNEPDIGNKDPETNNMESDVDNKDPDVDNQDPGIADMDSHDKDFEFDDMASQDTDFDHLDINMDYGEFDPLAWGFKS